MTRAEKTLLLKEVVLVPDKSFREAHKALYHFTDNSYIIAGEGLFESFAAFTGDHDKLHIASHWVDIVKLAIWKAEPDTGDLLLLLRNIGIKAEELLPFRNSALSDIFPWLYYGKRLDVLRRVCFEAKTKAEKHMRGKNMRIHCHLISEETNTIIASSL